MNNRYEWVSCPRCERRVSGTKWEDERDMSKRYARCARCGFKWTLQALHFV
jgi:DNA-directed RNA polymerase subunit RPC12/RpoP